jgi:hypothetical protein
MKSELKYSYNKEIVTNFKKFSQSSLQWNRNLGMQAGNLAEV